MLDAKEVTTETNYTKVAHTPQEVLGLVNIRGHIYLALDLRRLLGMPTIGLTSDSRLLLFKPSVGNAFGVVVDRISEIHSCNPEQIEKFSTQNHSSNVSNMTRVDLIDSICKLSDKLIVVLNPRKFLTIVEQDLARSA